MCVCVCVCVCERERASWVLRRCVCPVLVFSAAFPCEWIRLNDSSHLCVCLFFVSCVFVAFLSLWLKFVCLCLCVSLFVSVCVSSTSCDTVLCLRGAVCLLPSTATPNHSHTHSHTKPKAPVASLSLEPYRSSVPSLLIYTPTHTQTLTLSLSLSHTNTQNKSMHAYDNKVNKHSATIQK